MIIANPIYDTIFKHLMEDLAIAHGFLSLVLGRKIHHLNFYNREQSRYIPENVSVKERIKLFRLDFVADIETDGGVRKVLIELQKSSEHDAAHRFRAYIGRAYTQEKETYERLLKEERRASEREQRAPRPVDPPEILPVIPIVVLGFKLDPSVPSSEDRLICHIKRKAVNPNAGNAELDVQYQLAECLSHDLILIQIPYIPEEPRTDLELLLSIFEQRFLCQDAWKKEYLHRLQPGHPLQPLLRDMLHKLHLITEDAEVAEQIRAEEEGELFYSNIMASMEAKDRALLEKDRVLDQVAQERDRALRARDDALRSAVKVLMSKGMSEAEAKASLGLSDPS